jgi:DNA-binding response OmpR family regulator
MQSRIVIVLADDDPTIANLVKYRLESYEFEVHVGNDGSQALSLIQGLVPDMVILDLMMPVLSGFEVLKAMQGSLETKDIPTIILSARENEEDVLKGFELGAVDYVTKPFSPVELAARVRANLNGKLK